MARKKPPSAGKQTRRKSPPPPPKACLPTSTTDPDYQEWLDQVCTQGGGFVAPAGASEPADGIPAINARFIVDADGQLAETV
jgi:hypothetical protein